MKNKKGFTLTEILVTIAIIGAIIAVAIPLIMTISNSIKDREYNMIISLIETEAEEYAKNNSAEFGNAREIGINVETLIAHGYLKADVNYGSQDCKSEYGCILNPKDKSIINAIPITIKTNEDNTLYESIYAKEAVTELAYKFDLNGASKIGANTLSCPNDFGKCEIKFPTITRDGYEILGWSTDEEATTPSKKVGYKETITLENNGITYYAITSGTLKAIFDVGNYGTIADSEKTKECKIYNKDESCEIITPNIENIKVEIEEGYSLVWNSDENATIASLDGLPLNGSANLYASEKVSSPVTLVLPNKNKSSDNSKTIKTGSALKLISAPIPTKFGATVQRNVNCTKQADIGSINNCVCPDISSSVKFYKERLHFITDDYINRKCTYKIFSYSRYDAWNFIVKKRDADGKYNYLCQCFVNGAVLIDGKLTKYSNDSGSCYDINGKNNGRKPWEFVGSFNGKASSNYMIVHYGATEELKESYPEETKVSLMSPQNACHDPNNYLYSECEINVDGKRDFIDPNKNGICSIYNISACPDESWTATPVFNLYTCSAEPFYSQTKFTCLQGNPNGNYCKKEATPIYKCDDNTWTMNSEKPPICSKPVKKDTTGSNTEFTGYHDVKEQTALQNMEITCTGTLGGTVYRKCTFVKEDHNGVTTVNCPTKCKRNYTCDSGYTYNKTSKKCEKTNKKNAIIDHYTCGKDWTVVGDACWSYMPSIKHLTPICPTFFRTTVPVTIVFSETEPTYPICSTKNQTECDFNNGWTPGNPY